MSCLSNRLFSASRFSLWCLLIAALVPAAGRAQNVASLALAPSFVVGGQPSTGTVLLSAATTTAIIVPLSSSSPGFATMQKNLIIPQGQISGSFTITTTLVSAAPVTVTITAGAQTASLVLGPTWAKARISEIGADFVRVVSGDGLNALLTARAPDTKASLKLFSTGDRVDITFTDETTAKVLQTIAVSTQTLSPSQRLCPLLIGALIWIVVLWVLFGFGLHKSPLALIIGEDGRYSNSKFQVFTWFSVLIVTYVTTAWLRGHDCGVDFAGGISIPQNLLLLSGLSAFTFAAAKGITQNKVNAANAAAAANAGDVNADSASGESVSGESVSGENASGGASPPTKDSAKKDKSQTKDGTTKDKSPTNPAADAPHFLSDLLRDDNNNVDLGDFQMLVVTMLAVAVYLVQVYGWLGTLEYHAMVTLPDVDTTILAAFGLGHGAYLVKKYSGDISQ